MVLGAKHLLRVGLVLLVTVFPAAKLYAQPNNPDSSNAVSLTAVARNLRSLNLLTEATYQEVTRLIELGGLRSRSALLRQVEQDAVIRLRRLLAPYVRNFSNVHISVDNFTDEMRSEFLQIGHQLKESGVLSDRVYKHLQAEIVAGHIQLDIQLFRHAAMQMEIYEQLQPARVEPFLNSLREPGVISHAGYTQLLQALTAGTIENSIEFLNYFDRAVLFDLRDYSEDPYDYFPKIHQTIAQMLTKTGVANITLNDFALELETGVDIDYSDNNAIVSVSVNGRQYQQSSYYSTPKDKNDFLGRIDSDQFIHLFNKILRDRGSPYRLYAQEAFSYDLGMPGVDDSRFGVLALTDNQAKIYFKQDELRSDTLLTTDRVEEILTLMEKIGLFSHLTKEQIAAGRQQIKQSYITHLYELLEAFDDLVVTFDWETGNIDNPYQELTYDFAAASRGAFAPTDISNQFDWEKQIAGQSFTLNGTRYSTKLKFNNDWLDPEFFTFIERVVEQTVPTGRFYPLYYDEIDVFGYIFLTDEQRRVLQSEGLVVLAKPTERD